MNILVGIIILHAENRFISLAYVSMGWQAVELAVLSWAALCHTVTQEPHSFYLVPPPPKEGTALVYKDKAESLPPTLVFWSVGQGRKQVEAK